MRAIAAVVLVVPSLAAARPFTAGVGVGLTQAKDNNGAGVDNALQLFGRVGLTSRLAAELEVQKISGANASGEAKSATGLLFVELADNVHWVPFLLAGFGVDRGDYYGTPINGTHTEGGLGLEYRADGGFTIGVDLRIGGRSVDQDVYYDYGYDYMPPGPLQAGEYRSGHVTMGVRF